MKMHANQHKLLGAWIYLNAKYQLFEQVVLNSH